MSVEASYAVRGRKEHHVDGASISVVLRPRPEVLTLIAILASLLGLVLALASVCMAIVLIAISLYWAREAYRSYFLLVHASDAVDLDFSSAPQHALQDCSRRIIVEDNAQFTTRGFEQ